MNEESEGIFSCKGICWITGILLGFAAYLIARGRYEMGFLIALIIGLVIVIGVALALRAYFCAEVEETAGGFAAMSAQRSAERKEYEAARAEARAEEAAEKAAAKQAKDSEAAELEAAEEAAAEEARQAAAAAKEAEARAEEAAKAEAAKAEQAARQEAAKAEASAKATAPTARPAGEAAKPEGLEAAREEGADDLKQIKGIGPKLEALLNSHGIYHFDQIAAWSEAEIAWMDDNLKGFKGRVSRDEWIKQARILAEGGTTEFARKVKKGDVY